MSQNLQNLPLPSVYAVASSASASDVFCFFGVRPSSRSLSGFVAVTGFSKLETAALFSRTWSKRLPAVCQGCSVRKSSKGHFNVSIPVSLASVPASCRVSNVPVWVSGSWSSVVSAFNSRLRPLPALPPVFGGAFPLGPPVWGLA